MLRQFMRSSHNERWDGEKDLYTFPGKQQGLLC